MPTKSRIEWTGSTWNPVTGCNKVSAGCEHCYAERMARRLQAMGVDKYRHGFEVTLHPETLEEPLRWRKPRMVFVNSMSDLFHDAVPQDYLEQIFDIMRRCPQHVFQVLTKRSKQMVRRTKSFDWPSNVWAGVTVESGHYVYRINDLRKTGAAVKWLSLEPLIGPMPPLDLSGIDWAVIGGESGPGARPMQRSWVVDIRQQCRTQSVAFFFKQWGGVNKKRTGRTLDGRLYDNMPSALDHHVQQYGLPL